MSVRRAERERMRMRVVGCMVRCCSWICGRRGG